MAQRLVVIGLGYVGLPLVAEAVRAGLDVTGYDRSADVVAGLNAGRSHIDDLSDAEVADLVVRGFTATGDPGVLADADVAVICVPTPLSADGGPDLSAVLAATRDVADHLHAGELVVLESTTYPGTTEEVVQPLLAATGLAVGIDVHLAFSPERIDPGNPRYGLSNTPKVVGGVTPACTEAARAFYAQVVNRVVVARGTREAEMTKLLENTYRHVNIALVNELAILCHELGIDLWDAIACASTKPFGYQMLRPGGGGHCIPIDPNYLSHRVRTSLGYPFRFVELAQEINARMPSYVARRAQDLLNDAGKPVRGSRVLLLGVTYKPDIADLRESPAVSLAQALLSMGADLQFHDPYVPEWTVGSRRFQRTDLAEGIRDADLVILVQDHAAYDMARLAVDARLLLDTRGVAPDGSAHRM